MALDELVLGSTTLISEITEQHELVQSGLDFKSLAKLICITKNSVLFDSKLSVARSILTTLFENARGFSAQNSNGYFVKYEENSRLKNCKIITI